MTDLPFYGSVRRLPPTTTTGRLALSMREFTHALYDRQPVFQGYYDTPRNKLTIRTPLRGTTGTGEKVREQVFVCKATGALSLMCGQQRRY